MLHEADGQPTFRVARGIDQTTIQDPQFQVSRSIVARVAREGRPLLTSDAQQDERLSLIGLLMLNLSGVFPMYNPGILPAILVILAVTVLFLLCMFTFGMLVSTLSQNSITSLITVLFIWVLFVLVISKIYIIIKRIVRSNPYMGNS